MEMEPRIATVDRETKETKVRVEINLDGRGNTEVDTGLPFFDHMLSMMGKHGLIDIKIKAEGDLDVDGHHTVEDVGICLGQAFKQAIGDKRGIRRYGHALMPMDESLATVALDISGRPYLVYNAPIPVELIGTYDPALTEEFFHAFVNNSGITLHVRLDAGRNAHHMVEAIFKSLGKALESAVQVNPRVVDVIPSTKGMLDW